jgi:hypothetical protein
VKQVESGISYNLTGQALQESVNTQAQDMSIEDGSNAQDSTKQFHYDLGIRLRALYSFFNIRNHPLPESELANLSSRNFICEARIARELLLQNARLANGLVRGARSIEDGIDDITFLGGSASTQLNPLNSADNIDNSLTSLAENFNNTSELILAMIESSKISYRTFISMGKIVLHMLECSKAVRSLTFTVKQQVSLNLQPALVQLSYSLQPEILRGEVLNIFTSMARCLNYLALIETDLRNDRPLKRSLSIFTLVHEESRSLLASIQSRTMRIEGVNEDLINAMDGTVYAIGMELRKIFKYELVGLSSLRNASQIYAKVENSHGLLRDCFQQSTLALAQIFNPNIDGAHLFNVFQTRLEQSLVLCKDLWSLKLMVKQEEKNTARRSLAPLIEQLRTFRDGSMRYLMYKDWEAYERFVEELATARGESEINPLLHRFGCYLETLFGQIRMRAVLANYPLELEGVTTEQ